MFEPIIKSESKWNTGGRNIILNLSKKNKEAEPDDWWPRLTLDKTKNQLISIDWSKWIDPDDDEDDNQNKGMGDFDPNNMQDFNMGGAMGDDSDDEEGEESQVDPYVPDETKNLDDLDAEETQDLKK